MTATSLRATAVIVLMLSCLMSHAVLAAQLTGAGGQFLGDLYTRWGDGYEQTTGVRLEYFSVGSVTGLARLRERAVTFAISAIPLTRKELEASGLVQFPIAIGGVVPIANVPGVDPGALVLDGSTLGKIIAGGITRWNDPTIRALNPRLSLPAQRILPIYPTGNFGLDFLFSAYLTEVSADFRQWSKSGRSKQRARTLKLARAGVHSAVLGTPGALSYVEFARAKSRELTPLRLINRTGKVITPSASSLRAAAENADWRSRNGYYAILTNQRGAESWPITGAGFVLMHANVENGLASGEALRFFDWTYNRGGAFAGDSEFVPLSATLIEAIQQSWRTSILRAKQPLWLVK